MFGLRSKLLVGFGGLLLIVLVVSVIAQTVMEHYSEAIRKSYREDYESVAACQRMKGIVDQMNVAAEAVVWDRTPAPANVDRIRAGFERELGAQRQEATLPGESAATEDLARAWDEYIRAYNGMPDPLASVQSRRTWYRDRLLPGSRTVEGAAQRLIDMNLKGILAVPAKAQASTRRAHWAMRTLTVSAFLLALLFAVLIGRIILRPVRALTDSVHEVEQGNLDLSVPVHSHDELGALAVAFNTMAQKLLAYRQVARDRLVRTEQTTQLAIDSLPDAVLVVNSDRRIELANVAARKMLGLALDEDAALARSDWLEDVVSRACDAEHPTELSDYESVLQIESGGETRYYLPRSAPIVDASGRRIGATVVLADVSGLRRLDEMKNSLLSMVSHELKTPLTSVRMILHLFGDGKAGTLTAKQVDLLQTAREDTERLHRIIEDLLDMSRIESGRALMELRPVPISRLIKESVDPLRSMFQEVKLRVEIPETLPDVWADPSRIGHVFANLMLNSLRHTPPGGSVTVTAALRGDDVEYAVRDTGSGIPRQYVQRVFEKFFRVPGANGFGGSGLGLAIVKDIVDSHGGQIRVESTENVGTTVAFTLRTSPPG